MNTKRFIRDIFATLLVGVNTDSRSCYIRILRLKKGKIISDEFKEFKTVSGDIPIEAAKFIRRLRKNNPFTYIAAMSHSIHQGAIGTIDKEEYRRFGIRSKEVHGVEIQGRWTTYIAHEGIAEARQKFAKSYGFDFLFSPFVLLYKGVKKRLDSKKRLYVLQRRSDLALGVMDKEGLYFGGFFILESEVSEGEGEKGEGAASEESVSEEATSAMSSPPPFTEALSALDNELEEIGALEELDDSVILEDFEEHEVALPSGDEPQQNEKSALDDFARAMNVARLVKDSLGEFYKNDVYASDFIDEIVILDTYGISSSALTYLKNTLLIEVKTILLDVTSLLVDLAQSELREREGEASGV